MTRPELMELEIARYCLLSNPTAEDLATHEQNLRDIGDSEPCPQCVGNDKYCVYCGGRGRVDPASVAEWLRQNV
jgi:hypothetical protein